MCTILGALGKAGSLASLAFADGDADLKWGSLAFEGKNLDRTNRGVVMDPLTLAAAVVALLVPFFREAAGGIAERTGEMVAESALPKVKALYERVRAKLARGSYRGALLDGVQEEPDDAGRQEILKAELAKVIGEDREFAAELARLVDDAHAAGGIHIKASDAGVVAGRDVHQWAGGDVVGRDKIGGDQVGGDKITYAPPPEH